MTIEGKRYIIGIKELIKMYTPQIIALILEKTNSVEEFEEYLLVYSNFLDEESSRLISLDSAQPFFEMENQNESDK